MNTNDDVSDDLIGRKGIYWDDAPGASRADDDTQPDEVANSFHGVVFDSSVVGTMSVHPESVSAAPTQPAPQAEPDGIDDVDDDRRREIAQAFHAQEGMSGVMVSEPQDFFSGISQTMDLTQQPDEVQNVLPGAHPQGETDAARDGDDEDGRQIPPAPLPVPPPIDFNAAQEPQPYDPNRQDGPGQAYGQEQPSGQDWAYGQTQGYGMPPRPTAEQSMERAERALAAAGVRPVGDMPSADADAAEGNPTAVGSTPSGQDTADVTDMADAQAMPASAPASMDSGTDGAADADGGAETSDSAVSGDQATPVVSVDGATELVSSDEAADEAAVPDGIGEDSESDAEDAETTESAGAEDAAAATDETGATESADAASAAGDADATDESPALDADSADEKDSDEKDSDEKDGADAPDDGTSEEAKAKKKIKRQQQREHVMRHIVAPISAALAVIVLIFGILNATVWKPQHDISATASDVTTQYSTIASAVLQLVDDDVHVAVTSQDSSAVICAQVMQSSDASAWVAGVNRTQINGMKSWSELSMQQSADGDADTSQDMQNMVPQNSDMWIGATCGTGTIELDQSALAKDSTLVIATDADKAGMEDAAGAPYSVTLSWHRDSVPNYALPFFVVAAVFVLLALLAIFLFSKETTKGDDDEPPAWEQTAVMMRMRRRERSSHRGDRPQPEKGEDEPGEPVNFVDVNDGEAVEIKDQLGETTASYSVADFRDYFNQLQSENPDLAADAVLSNVAATIGDDGGDSADDDGTADSASDAAAGSDGAAVAAETGTAAGSDAAEPGDGGSATDAADGPMHETGAQDYPTPGAESYVADSADEGYLADDKFRPHQPTDATDADAASGSAEAAETPGTDGDGDDDPQGDEQ